MSEKKELLTTAQVCDLLGVHYNTVYKWIKDGRLPASRIGAKYLFDKDQILKVLQLS